MNAEKILIIDDESSIRRILRLGLESQGFEIAEAASGPEGLKKAKTFKPRIVVLDLGLPGMTGAEVLKELRDWSSVPVIVLTVTDDEAVKVDLLNAGADDYVTKPFGMAELLARISVALRHSALEEANPKFTSGELEIDLTKRIVMLRGKPVKFTATEFSFLKLLVKHAGRVVTQEHLLNEIWGPNAKENTHYLRIYAAQLRKKIEANPASPEHLLTEPGVGYRLV